MLIFSLLMLIIGLGIFINQKARIILIYLGILSSLLFWVVGQNLAGYYTGLATDIDTAPLIILVGFSVLSIEKFDIKITNIYKKIETLVT